MARVLWKGAISFGLVNIPVELHPATDHKSFKFSMLDKRDLSPVGYKRFSKASGKEVPWEDIVKGYEYEKDQYVVLSDEDFRQANVKATQTIDIRAFVSADEIPVEYYETPYYLMARIKQKIKQGRTAEITEADRGEAAPRSAQVIDLAALLKESLAKGAGGRKPALRGTGATTRGKPAPRAASRTAGKRTSAKTTATGARRRA